MELQDKAQEVEKIGTTKVSEIWLGNGYQLGCYAPKEVVEKYDAEHDDQLCWYVAGDIAWVSDIGPDHHQGVVVETSQVYKDGRVKIPEETLNLLDASEGDQINWLDPDDGTIEFEVQS